jgi:hypothetical protein
VSWAQVRVSRRQSVTFGVACLILRVVESTDMTEAEWLTPANSWEVSWEAIDCLRGRASSRQLRLLGCAGARRFSSMMRDERSRKALEVSERYADGLASQEELAAAIRAAAAAEEDALRAMKAADDAWKSVWKNLVAQHRVTTPGYGDEKAAIAEEASIVAGEVWSASQRATWAAEGFTFEPLNLNGDLSPLV